MQTRLTRGLSVICFLFPPQRLLFGVGKRQLGKMPAVTFTVTSKYHFGVAGVSLPGAGFPCAIYADTLRGWDTHFNNVRKFKIYS